ncbi:uncharacterized protein LOC120122336 [Hibiscus syriacus]|uniref:uncharacterized protein LOC120122336 n=1 Tax=Hibiscus syriacus TaxID=106335 RepID=UPI001921CCC4|nr:uncharacterized protein LOC120122336 [Hibiscus syriacus]
MDNIWIRLPGLPYRYYTKALFRLIASVVGQVIKVDYNTQAGERGKFARITVLVDLNQPLIPCIGIDGFTQKLEYERSQQICFHCGVYGHTREQCAAYQVHIESKREEELNERNKNNHNLATTSEETLFGPWMVVENRRRKTTTTQKTEKDNMKQKAGIEGSRFTILSEDENGHMAEIKTGTDDKEDNENKNKPVNRETTKRNSPDHQTRGTNLNMNNMVPKQAKKMHESDSIKNAIEVIQMIEGQNMETVEHITTAWNGNHTAITIKEPSMGKKCTRLNSQKDEKKLEG